MPFRMNSYQQLSLADSFSGLTSREQKALEHSWAKLFAGVCQVKCVSFLIFNRWLFRPAIFLQLFLSSSPSGIDPDIDLIV